MFFCGRNSLFKVLLALFGLKLFLKRERWSEEEKETYRAKRRAFRQKLREAFDVWDEPCQPSNPADTNS
ncbi:MAG: hypothetical protein K6T83_06305 [Alicyclobacillus sp.]|nr:hypothetical protein [Alicyclobacillus sp.]